MTIQDRLFGGQNGHNHNDDEQLIDQNISETYDNGTSSRENEAGQQDASSKPIVYTSQLAVLLITINVTVGVGLLAMPFSMQVAGVVPSMLVQVVFLALVIITCIMCIELTIKSGVNSYHAIIAAHCHPLVYQFTQVAILLIVFGTSIAYIVTIGDQADRLFASLYGPTFCKSWYMNRRFIMSFVTLITIKPLCSARTVDFLKYGSFLGILSIGFIFYVVTSQLVKQGKVAQDINFGYSWSQIVTILPVFCLAYQCHISLVPIVATIRPRDKPKGFVTASVAMVTSLIIYSSISIIALLTFGSAIQNDLTESFSDKRWPTLTTIFVVGLKCVLTLPCAYLPARISIIDILNANWTWFSQLKESVQRLSVTIIFLDLALLLALYVPNIVVAVNLLGCIAVFFMFTLPGLAYINLVKQNRLEKQLAVGGDSQVPQYTSRDTMKRVASYFMIVFGVSLTVLVLYKSITELLSSRSSEPLCRP